MNITFRSRLKAALKSFINPIPTAKLLIRTIETEPSAIANHQLLTGKNVLITGAGRNIGRSIALELAKQGANIFFTDILQDHCEHLEQELISYNVQSKGFISNIANPEDSNLLHQFFVENKIFIDILINNVGTQIETTEIKNLDLREWHTTYETNVFGPIYLTKLISQHMVNQQCPGSIIFITSIHQWETVRWLSYSSSKAALGMIIKELATELAPAGIRVNGVAPGWVAEDEHGNPLNHRYTPLYNSSINPCYIGRAVVYLASDYFSRFTTGTVIKVDAGLSLYNYRVAQHECS